jgi:hypothetical protein
LTCTVDHPVGSGGTGSSTVSNCFGLGADGYSVVIDYANSAVTFPQGQLPVGGDVPATLSLTLGAAPSFSPLIAGVARDYFASTTATVTSSAGDAALIVQDTSPFYTNHLVNGSFALAQELQVQNNNGQYQTMPAGLRFWGNPTSNEVVPVNFKQSVGQNDPLRTGMYSKTLTFTLSTTSP